MNRRSWIIPVVVFVSVASAHESSAQTAASTPRSTQAGVYTEEQATRGRDTYAASCSGCHTPASHSGAVFTTSWAGRLLSELFDFTTQTMPKQDPGSLSPKEYAQVVAYLLKLNGMPAGSTELPTDSLALKKIKIEAAKGS